MDVRRAALTGIGTLALAASLAACSGGSNGDGTPSVTVTATVTATPTPTPTPAATSPAASTPATGGGDGSSSGTVGGPGLCTPTVATFTVGPDQGAAGTSFFPITVTNASQRPCVTTGFPGIALLDGSGKQILQAVRESGGQQPATIVLAPGEQATTQVGASSMGPSGSACSTTSPTFLITLPDNTDSTKITHATEACTVRVGAFVKGATLG